jgi:hypothetical protein
MACYMLGFNFNSSNFLDSLDTRKEQNTANGIATKRIVFTIDASDNKGREYSKCTPNLANKHSPITELAGTFRININTNFI